MPLKNSEIGENILPPTARSILLLIFELTEQYAALHLVKKELIISQVKLMLRILHLMLKTRFLAKQQRIQ